VAQRKTYFDQVPVETVRKLAELDFADEKRGDTPPAKEKRPLERPLSDKQGVSERGER
jgi:hypothetical protein